MRDKAAVPSTYVPIDFAARDAANRVIGRHGEEFMIAQESLRLTMLGRDDLVSRIEWIADTRGPTAGFDIRSFEPDGSDRFVEVKTTNLSMHAPFYITHHEVQTSERLRGSYHLCRVFSFARDPRYFVLSGAVRSRVRLEPQVYLARP